METLLLLHGAIGSNEQLTPLAQKLKNDFTVHTPNFSGHGGASMPDIFNIETFSNDILNYLNANQIDKTTIFGYSMGGYVALYLAKHFPERINKVITVATKFLWTAEIALQEIKFLNAAKIIEKLPAFATTLKKQHLPNNWEVVLQKTVEMIIGLGANPSLTMTDYEQLAIPALIGVGDKDTMVTLEETIAVFRKLKNANLMVLPNTPHPIEKMDLEMLYKAVILFLKHPIHQTAIL